MLARFRDQSETHYRNVVGDWPPPSWLTRKYVETLAETDHIFRPRIAGEIPKWFEAIETRWRRYFIRVPIGPLVTPVDDELGDRFDVVYIAEGCALAPLA